jgi:hypothetical protein
MTQPDPPDPALELAYELRATLADLIRRLEKNEASKDLLDDARQIIRRAYAAAFEVPEGGPGRRSLLVSLCAHARERLQKFPSQVSEAAEVNLVVRTYDEIVDEEGAKLGQRVPRESPLRADESLDARTERLAVAARDEAERLAKRLELVRAVLVAATPRKLEEAEMALIKAMGFAADPESVKRHARRVKKKSRE